MLEQELGLRQEVLDSFKISTAICLVHRPELTTKVTWAFKVGAIYFRHLGCLALQKFIQLRDKDDYLKRIWK